MKPIKIGMMTEDGTWKILGSYSTYEKADSAHDKYCDKYPYAWIEILDGALAD